MSGIDNSFGSTPAGVILCNLLQKDPKMMSKFGKKYSEFSAKLKELSKVDIKYRIEISRLVYSDTLKNNEFYPDEIKQFVDNVLKAKYRNWVQIEFKNHNEYKEVRWKQ